ncbi:MAG: DUF1553 domain-containing protein, partial [Planctomycetaceae bacterium]
SGGNPKGGLDLTTVGAARKGGESGVAIVPRDLNASLLWRRVSGDEMPPKKPLNALQKQTLRNWIESGATWGTSPLDRFRVTTASRAGYDWWALQPVRSPVVPVVEPATWVRNPIDAFVLKKLALRKLTPSPAASNQVLIRRLYFDLIGLPPTPSHVARFERESRDDPELAWKTLVDRLLNSQHFGERWGRHWLDVARFGESQGFERDKLRNNSWHYRDWVIQALNDDMPYDTFVRQQIAGDVLAPHDPQSVIATGFLVAGPWDEVGQSMRSKTMKAVVRQDEIEDYVGTIGQTFLGLTVNCARCHDHKFDPIRQQEYYQLAAAVAGVRHGSREVISPESQQRLRKIDLKIRAARKQIAAIDAGVRNRLHQRVQAAPKVLPPRARPIARWDFEKDTNDRIGTAHATQHPQAKIMNGRLVLDQAAGYAATHMQNTRLAAKTIEAWVRLDNLQQRGGAAISVHDRKGAFDALVFAERQPGKWMAGSDFFKRTKDLAAAAESQADSAFIHLAMTYAEDGTISCYRQGVPYGAPYKSTKPWLFEPGQWYVMFGLRNGGPSPKRQLQGLIETAQLYDRALSPQEVNASFRCEQVSITHEQILAALSDAERQRRQEVLRSIKALIVERKQSRPYSVYAVKPQTAEVAHVLHRGNPASRGAVVKPGGVAAIAALEAGFGLEPDADDADRRRKLAEWVTDHRNPLFSRVIVNRLWHYHFGTGLVATPNDFGFNGGRPSHPELIDWLASELVKSGWRLKHIHRLIVSSATYQQASRYRDDCAAVDADNRLLWRKTPLRLEAEVLRDAILSVSGQLNRRFGGAPYQDFTTVVNNTQFYKMADKDDPEVYRRTVYRTWVRSGRNHLLDAFDCPDPSTTAPARAVTTTPIQSLALMNNAFVLRMADRCAARVRQDAGADAIAQADRLFRIAYGRAPGRAESQRVASFITDHGLPALCRVVFNSNEFVYAD